jgi:hypothetical protein
MLRKTNETRQVIVALAATVAARWHNLVGGILGYVG